MDWLAQCRDNVTEWDSRSWWQCPDVPVRQLYEVTISAHCPKSVPTHTTPTRCVPKLPNTASYLAGPLVNSSSGANVAVLLPVPFPTCV